MKYSVLKLVYFLDHQEFLHYANASCLGYQKFQIVLKIVEHNDRERYLRKRERVRSKRVTEKPVKKLSLTKSRNLCAPFGAHSG